jgi:hypothetical protein
MHLKSLIPLPLLLLLLLLSGCRKPTTDAAVGDNGYFSIKQFVADQYQTYRGTPFVIEKLMVLNGEKDSAVLNSYNLDWAPILSIFLNTDISHDRFTDQYEAVLFDDGAGAHVLYYTAKAEKLLTRVFQIRIDAATNRILSLYIETARNSFWNSTTRKLYYVPMKLIQIQEFSRPMMGRKKDLRIEYRFML